MCNFLKTRLLLKGKKKTFYGQSHKAFLIHLVKVVGIQTQLISLQLW